MLLTPTPTLIFTLLTVALASVAELEPAYDCTNGRGSSPSLALTFNGGPNEWTPAILTVLRAANVIATFFVDAGLFVSSPQRQATLKQMVADGHTIACHASAPGDNAACHDQLIKVIGIHNVLRRPLQINDIAGEVIDARTTGQVVTLWNYDVGDWATGTSPGDIVARFRSTLATSMNRSRNWGEGVGRRHGTFIVVMQNGAGVLGKAGSMTVLEGVLVETRSASAMIVSMGDCLNVKAYSAYSTPSTGMETSWTTSNTVIFAILFAALFGVLAAAAALYSSARRKLHEQARQRELGRAAIGVMVSQGIFKGDRRDFEQSVPVDFDDADSAQRPNLTPPQPALSAVTRIKRKKDFHDLKSSHYTMAIDPHRRHHPTPPAKKRPQRIVYPKSTTKKASGVTRRSNSAFAFDDDLELGPTTPVPTRVRLVPTAVSAESSVEKSDQLTLPFEPFDYGDSRRKSRQRSLSSGSVNLLGMGKSRGDDEDGLDDDFREEFVMKRQRSRRPRPRPHLEEVWVRQRDHNGQEYYWNRVTNQSTWTKPRS